MAAGKVTISEFTIKVKLNAAEAKRGLTALEKRLQKFQNKANEIVKRSIQAQRASMQQVSAVKGATKAQGKLNEKLGEGNRAVIAMNQGFKNLKGWALGGLGLWAAFNMLQKMADLVSTITSKGMKVQQSMLTMDAAIGASDIGQSLSPEALKDLQRDQKLFVENLARTYGVGMSDSMANYAKFFAASSNYIGAKGSQDLFTSISQLGVVYGLSADKMNRAMTAFTQMASKNQVMAEELKQQLGDVLPGSMEIFARAMTRMGKYGTVTVEKLYDMMAKGKIVASEVLPYVTEEMRDMAAGSIEAAKALLSVRFGRLSAAAEIFSTGALNQFDDTLGRIVDKLIVILEGRGLQTRVGHWINSLLLQVESLLDTLTEGFAEFEKQFESAKTATEKWEVLDNFWSTIFKWDEVKAKLVEMFSKMKEALKTPAKDFGRMIGESIAEGISTYLSGISVLDIFGDNIGFGNLDMQPPIPLASDQIGKNGFSGLLSGSINITNDNRVEVHGANDPDGTALDAQKNNLETQKDITVGVNPFSFGGF